jgi:arsenate reductase (glutaredoxin)
MTILNELGVDADVVEYLQAPPDRATLERIVAMLPTPPGELVRKDDRFKELGLKAADYETAGAVVDLLLEHPELMERPVVVVGDRAVIGRPPERVHELLSS